MAAPSLTEEQLLEAAKAFREHGTQLAAANALKMSRPTFQHRIQQAALKGYLDSDKVLPGFELKKVGTQHDENGNLQREWRVQTREAGEPFTVPEGQSIKGVSALLGPDGRVMQKWVKTANDRIDPATFVAELKEHFKDFAPYQPPTPAPNLDYSDRLALVPVSDIHMGLRTWGAEVGENWDLNIAVDVARRTFDEAIASTPATREAILLVGGDTLHADDNRNVTPRSGNHLQVDGRHQKVFLTACETLVEHVNTMLTKFEKIDVVVLPGNHDETSAAPVAFFLYAWFRNEPRVTVDLSPSVHRFRLWGRVYLGFTHGHTCKFHRDFPGIMASYEPKFWGASLHRVGHGFHVHHKSEAISESAGVVTETHQVLCPPDAWHYGAGYKAGRAQQCIVYDRELGEVIRIRVPVIVPTTDA